MLCLTHLKTFSQQVNNLKGCIHSHIACVINVFEANEQLVVVSEFCGGGDVIHR